MRGGARHTWLLLLLLLVSPSCGDDSPTQTEPEPTLSLDFEGSSLGPATVVGDTVFFSLRPDTNAPTRYWFAFRVDGGAGRTLTFRLEDATRVASPLSWDFKRPVASGDGGVTWSRITDTFVALDGSFVFRHAPSSPQEHIALALPYPFSRWLDLLEALEGAPGVRVVRSIGRSLGGTPVHLLEITDPEIPAVEKTGLWVVARQHPGEPEGSFMLEGFLDWILSGDPGAAELRRRAEVFVAGLLNPDGVRAGNQRVNLAGVDLNRQWNEPDPGVAPTVHAFQQEVLSYVDTGGSVRMVLDFHGAPTGRSNFFFYNEEGTSSPEHHDEIIRLIQAAVRHNPDFVPLEGSTARPVPLGERARNWAFARLRTHGLTVEASANDVTYGPFAGQYVTEVRLLALGEAVGRAVAEVLYGVGSPSPAGIASSASTAGTAAASAGFPR